MGDAAVVRREVRVLAAVDDEDDGLAENAIQ
jgi:hypothetical protein